MTTLDFDQMLDKYAELAVRVGVNVQPGQQLVVSAQLEAAPLARRVAVKAYEAGAKHVFIDWEDEALTLARLQLAPMESLEQYPLPWKVRGFEQMTDENAAFLTIYSPNPDLLKDIDPARVAAANKAASQAMHEVRLAKQASKVSWSIVCSAGPKWASKVFPELSEEEAVQELWRRIFSVTRIDQPDPVHAWKEHVDSLRARAEQLTAKAYKKLHYKGPGVDLSIGLPEGHLWNAAGMENRQGTYYVPNMPTEEVFTLPSKLEVNGTVKSTLPLNYNGSLIDGFSLTFENGRVIDYTADVGYDTLKRLIETDEGSAYLGEVAIVPYDSPISRLNKIFYNTLFDENASSHLAIGSAYPFCLQGGTSMSQEELAARGANRSLTHVDFMIGSAALDIDGETADGRIEPLVRSGNWTG